MPSLDDVKAPARPQNHLVQFYGEMRELIPNVAAFLKDGVVRGEGMIVIATPAHRDAFLQALATDGITVDSLQSTARLTVLDAESTLAQVMVSGAPDAERFEAVVGSLVRQVKARSGTSGLRAYGEMVDLLWKSGRLEAATRLEELWNRLLQTTPFQLFCAYTVDYLSQKTPPGPLTEMLRTHSHLLPVRRNGELSRAVDQAFAEVLGAASVQSLLPLIRASRFSSAALPPPEAKILWMRIHLPAHAEAILSRARRYYEEECAGAHEEKGRSP